MLFKEKIYPTDKFQNNLYSTMVDEKFMHKREIQAQVHTDTLPTAIPILLI